MFSPAGGCRASKCAPSSAPLREASGNLLARRERPPEARTMARGPSDEARGHGLSPDASREALLATAGFAPKSRAKRAPGGVWGAAA
eukprot:6081450-Pyramimonas_sp.AAC.1